MYHMSQILLANSKSGERCYKKGHFSPLGGEYEPPFMLEKNRTSLQKSNSPAVSVVVVAVVADAALNIMGESMILARSAHGVVEAHVDVSLSPRGGCHLSVKK